MSAGTAIAAPDSTAASLARRSRPKGEWSIVWSQLRRNRAAMIGAAVIAIEILVAIFAPVVAPYGPFDADPRAALKPPSALHWFGTDDNGRDLFSRVIFGTRISLRVGLISVAIGGGVGILLGIVAGYRGGWIDNGVMRAMDLLLAFPGILLALGIIAILGPGLSNVMIAVGISAIPSYTRLARASTLALRDRDFVTGARAVGCGDGRIMARYVLPNVLPPLIVLTTLGVAGAILMAAGLSFIGLGAVPPTPEWGAILTLGRKYINQAWWYTTFPGLAIAVTVLGINMLGDALRDALDPRLRR
ncbi:MAG TPA: ABC transporter permease [Thermomicrobiales bacterium]|nr:ABC transporter permease [Thermomicrobiales bacterium]